MQIRFFALLLLAHCAPRASDLAAPCDPGTLQNIALDCRAIVRAECDRSDAGVVDPKCPTLIECNKRVDSWHDCTDGGAAK